MYETIVLDLRCSETAYPWVQQLLGRHQGDAAVPVQEKELIGLSLHLANV